MSDLLQKLFEQFGKKVKEERFAWMKKDQKEVKKIEKSIGPLATDFKQIIDKVEVWGSRIEVIKRVGEGFGQFGIIGT